MDKYVRGTKEMPLILGANGTGILKCYIDGSYGVHPNMRRTLRRWPHHGKRFPVTASKKQKLNTRSSIESEVVGVDDFMPGILWTSNFMKAQDYDVVQNIFFHDNIVNGAPFFITLSRKIDFLGISHLPGRKIQNIF